MAISLTASRYRVIAPNYRGAGRSSKPATGFTKSVMAGDIIQLLDALGIRSKVHLVGHDIGGMIAWAIATRHPDRLLTVNWDECPLPGTSIHKQDRIDRATDQFHFIFHCVRDLPEALIAGREEIYITHFFNKLVFNTAAIGPEDLDHYVKAYFEPGAMRCARGVQGFLGGCGGEQGWFRSYGKCKVPAIGLSGEKSAHCQQAGQMFAEVHEDGTYEVATVPDAGHYLAEENPQVFVDKILEFIQRHQESHKGFHLERVR